MDQNTDDIIFSLIYIQLMPVTLGTTGRCDPPMDHLPNGCAFVRHHHNVSYDARICLSIAIDSGPLAWKFPTQ